MRFFQQLGNMLDQIDSTKEDAEGDDPDDASGVATSSPSGSAASLAVPGADLVGRGFGLLTSAAATAAASATSAVVAAAESAAAASGAAGGLQEVSSLLGGDVHVDETERMSKDHLQDEGEVSAAMFSPSAGADVPQVQSSPSLVCEVDAVQSTPHANVDFILAPFAGQNAMSQSARSSVAEGWTLEDAPTSGPSSLRSPSPLPASASGLSIVASIAGSTENLQGSLPAQAAAPAGEEETAPLPQPFVPNAGDSTITTSARGTCDDHLGDELHNRYSANGNVASSSSRCSAANMATRSLPEASAFAVSPESSGCHAGAEAAALSVVNVEVESGELRRRIAELEAQAGEREEQLRGAIKQFERLQLRIGELESENVGYKSELLRLRDDAIVQRQKADEFAERLTDSSSQVSDLQQQLSAAEKTAKAKATREREDAVACLQKEMEGELDLMLKRKDDQIKELRSTIAASDKQRREQADDLERCRSEIASLTEKIESIHREGAGQQSDLRRQLDNLAAEHKQRLDELEECKATEERMRHEVALSVRGIEERHRAELAQLDSQRAHAEMQMTALHAQLQLELRKNDELSALIGEPHQHGELVEASNENFARCEALEAKNRDLQERLNAAESKLLDLQAMRDTYLRDAEMYRTELKVARDERSRLEGDLVKSEDRFRELQAEHASQGQSMTSEAMVATMRKDFEERTERYRDEVHYLRQKCDDKDRRYEQLLAEKSAMSAELRAGRGIISAAAAEMSGDLEAGGHKFEAKSNKKLAGGVVIRSLPLSAPAWLRSADEPLRMVVKTLASFPQARIAFNAYVVLLHIWVLFVMQSEVQH